MALGRPQTMVFTLFGEYLLPRESPVWVGSLIRLFRPFGISDGAVRTVLSRMARKRWLLIRRSGRNAYYTLATRGLRVVTEGKERIFHPPTLHEWHGRWCLVTYSIPEDVRHLRDRLRTRLSWFGFGSLGNGIWISPHDVHEQVASMAGEMGLEGRLVCFDAHQVGEQDHDAMVARCWNLPALAGRYRSFLSQWQEEMEECRRGLEEATLSDEDAFVRRFRLIHQYKDFPLEDPFLPEPLLPPDWPGREAGDLVAAMHDLLEAPANRHVASVLAGAPPYRGRLSPLPA